MCIPNSPAVKNAKYINMMRDQESVGQIARILTNYNSLPESMIEELLNVLPKICAWDFVQLRDGKAELGQLRN